MTPHVAKFLWVQFFTHSKLGKTSSPLFLKILFVVLLVSLGWALDPNLVERFPIMFDIMLSSLTPNDRLIAGDSGAGYINPDALLTSVLSSHCHLLLFLVLLDMFVC